MPQLCVDLPNDLAQRLHLNAHKHQMPLESRILEILNSAVAEVEHLAVRPGIGLEKLRSFLDRIPGVKVHSVSEEAESLWWVKFEIDIELPLAWNVVQELGYVLNYISLTDRLPTLFMPVSPPPYLNGG